MFGFSIIYLKNKIIQIQALANTMIGTVVLLIPINFGLAGALTSLTIMIGIGLCSFQTCKWIVDNTKSKENELSQVKLNNIFKKINN